jgi:hypothetical protein
LKPKRGEELKKEADSRWIKSRFAFSLHTPVMKTLVGGEE